MTVRVLTMPRLGETMDEGTIVAWLVKAGEAFQRGMPILEVETDKTVVEYPALGDGVLVETLAAEGDRVSVGDPIARVRVTGAGDWDGMELPQSLSSDRSDAPRVSSSSSTNPAQDNHSRRRATPVARRLARAAGLSLETIPGSGRRGRIERRDVEAAIKAPGVASTQGVAGRIAHETVGQGEEVFLLIHGFAADRSAWAVTASGLSRAGFRVVLPDLPSHGKTEAEAATFDDLVDGLAPFAESLGERIHLVGHSLGGAVAAGLAGRLIGRTASLTLIAPAGAGREINNAFIEGMAEVTTPAELAHLIGFLGPKGSELSDAALSAMAAEIARGRLKELAAAIAGPQGQRIDILRPLGALPAAVPVRAVIGTEDRVIPAEHAFNLPSRVAVHFVRAGHMPQWDAPRETLALLTGVADG